MIDLLLNSAGDLDINEIGDITPTESVIQAVRIRLLWFFSEWRLGPSFGIPYFEEILVKNPNIIKIRYLIRDQIKSVKEVTKVNNVTVKVDPKTRVAAISFEFEVGEKVYRDEVDLHGKIWPDS